MTQDPFKLLPLNWVFEHVILCALWDQSLFFLLSFSSPSFSLSLSLLLYASPTGLQSQTFWELTCLPSEEHPGWRTQCGAWTPQSLRRASAIVIILLFVGHLPMGVDLDYTVSLALLVILWWFLLYIFSCGKSFTLVFRSLSLIVALYVVIILVCSWEEMRSESSYSTILATPIWVYFRILWIFQHIEVRNWKIIFNY